MPLRTKVFKKYSQMKLQMKREALAKLNRSQRARMRLGVLIRCFGTEQVLIQFGMVGGRGLEPRTSCL
jgi:hypothetical protein